MTTLAAAAIIVGVLATDVLSVSPAKPVPPIELKQAPQLQPSATTKPTTSTQRTSTSKQAGTQKQPAARPPASPAVGAAPAAGPAPVCAGDHDAHPDDCAGDAEREVEGD